MPPKKNAKSNKTAHVLNLLSHSPEAEPIAETSHAPGDAAEATLLLSASLLSQARQPRSYRRCWKLHMR